MIHWPKPLARSCLFVISACLFVLHTTLFFFWFGVCVLCIYFFVILQLDLVVSSRTLVHFERNYSKIVPFLPLHFVRSYTIHQIVFNSHKCKDK